MFRFLFFIILSVTLATAGCRSTAPEPPPTPPPAPEPEQVEISDKTYSDAAVFALAMEILRKNYVDPDRATDARLLENALTGLAGELDPYSGYEPPAEFTENDSKRSGELVGIGVEVVKSANQPLLITGVMPGSPAQKGGLRPGDRIVEIGGKPTARLPMQECLNLTRGREGSEVELKYSRDAAAEPLAIRLTRAMIVRPSIPADAVRLLPGHIGYIKIESFTGHTPEEFRAALRKLKAQKLDGLILDLRNNPGGLVGSAVEIASIFLPENELILRTRDRHGRQTHEIRSTGDQPRELELPPGKENRMRIVNNKKFVTLNELATQLNSKKSEERFFYGVPELACAWADTRAKYYQATGKQVAEGIHYVTGDTPAEHLLSLEGCELIEKYATVDAHNVPVITDGAAELFN